MSESTAVKPLTPNDGSAFGGANFDVQRIAQYHAQAWDPERASLFLRGVYPPETATAIMNALVNIVPSGSDNVAKTLKYLVKSSPSFSSHDPSKAGSGPVAADNIINGLPIDSQKRVLESHEFDESTEEYSSLVEANLFADVAIHSPKNGRALFERLSEDAQYRISTSMTPDEAGSFVKAMGVDGMRNFLKNSKLSDYDRTAWLESSAAIDSGVAKGIFGDLDAGKQFQMINGPYGSLADISKQGLSANAASLLTQALDKNQLQQFLGKNNANLSNGELTNKGAAAVLGGLSQHDPKAVKQLFGNLNVAKQDGIMNEMSDLVSSNFFKSFGVDDSLKILGHENLNNVQRGRFFGQVASLDPERALMEFAAWGFDRQAATVPHIRDGVDAIRRVVGNDANGMVTYLETLGKSVHGKDMIRGMARQLVSAEDGKQRLGDMNNRAIVGMLNVLDDVDVPHGKTEDMALFSRVFGKLTPDKAISVLDTAFALNGGAVYGNNLARSGYFGKAEFSNQISQKYYAMAGHQEAYRVALDDLKEGVSVPGLPPGVPQFPRDQLEAVAKHQKEQMPSLNGGTPPNFHEHNLALMDVTNMRTGVIADTPILGPVTVGQFVYGAGMGALAHIPGTLQGAPMLGLRIGTGRGGSGGFTVGGGPRGSFVGSGGGASRRGSGGAGGEAGSGSSDAVGGRATGVPVLSRPWHDILGVAPDATPNAIEAAYKTLRKAAHPDQNAGSTAAFQDLFGAYRTGMLSSGQPLPADQDYD